MSVAQIRDDGEIRLPLSGWALDVAFIVVVALAALVVRTIGLEHWPDGLHGDEAVTGLDAAGILDGQSVFPYTPHALGQPSGFMYVTAPFIAIGGHSVIWLRLASACVGVATVVAGFFAIREWFGRPAAWIAAIMLAFSSWLIFYNRTAYPVTTMPLTEFASLLALGIAVRTGRWYAAVAAGAVIGAGIYGYYSYPLFALGLAIFAALQWLIERPRPLLQHARILLIAGAVAVLVTQPMWPYLLDNDRGYQHDRKLFSVSATPAYKQADTWGRIRLYEDQAGRVLKSLTTKGYPDGGDGSGAVPALDAATVVLAGAGIVFCTALAFYRRRAAYLMPLIFIPLLLIGPITSPNGNHRRSLGTLAFVIIPAAVLLAYLWDAVRERRPDMQRLMLGALAVVLAGYAAINLERYFDGMNSGFVYETVYAPELTRAALFVRDQPETTRVYWLSDRWSARYETMRFLLPERTKPGGLIEDRSREHSASRTTDWTNIDRSAPAVIMLIGNYRGAEGEIQRMYPGSQRVEGPVIAGASAYVALLVPPR